MIITIDKLKIKTYNFNMKKQTKTYDSNQLVLCYKNIGQRPKKFMNVQNLSYAGNDYYALGIISEDGKKFFNIFDSKEYDLVQFDSDSKPIPATNLENNYCPVVSFKALHKTRLFTFDFDMNLRAYFLIKKASKQQYNITHEQALCVIKSINKIRNWALKFVTQQTFQL